MQLTSSLANICLICLISKTFCWDNEDFVLFDLIEEVNQNFYQLLGVDQSANQSEIKRSYRKLSLQLHPDRNKEDNAEVKFRQLVSVYETLKDENLRLKYNEILINGLPDWRQPIYYYRHVRKMGLMEIFIALLIILTTGHFITLWAIYLERKFELQEIIYSKRKKERKTKKPKVDDDEINEQLNQIILDELGEKPNISQLLPIIIIKFCAYHLIRTPNYLIEFVEDLKMRRLQNRIADECKDELTTPDRERTKKQKYSFIDTLPIVDSNQDINSQNSIPKLSEPCDNLQNNYNQGEWTEDELDNLVKGVIKFPGGTPERWEKISQFVGRPIKEVLKMANELKYSNPTKSKSQFYTPTNLESGQGKESQNLNDEKVQMSNMERSNNDGVNFQIKSVSSQEANDSLADAWNRHQQKRLEAALISVSKDNPQRWESIAQLVQDKTKEECILRYKYLSQLVKRKKQNQS